MTTADANDKPDAPAEPAQGNVDTKTQYRDRPSDDGKNGDAAAQPRPNAAREDSAGN
jgi:hypothetical protein